MATSNRSRSKHAPPRKTDQGTPDYTRRDPLPLDQHPAPDGLLANFPPGTPLRYYTLGECHVIDTVRPDGRRQLSISHPTRYVNWDEIAEARYRILPRIDTMALLLPPIHRYINAFPNCFILVEVEPVEDI
jgi:hypothetical protein